MRLIEDLQSPEKSSCRSQNTVVRVEYERSIHTELRIGSPTVVRGADFVIVIQEAECRGGKANHDRRWSERAREGEWGLK